MPTFWICKCKLTMKMHVPKAMVEPFDINPMTKLWVTINNNGLLTQQPSEYLKLVENVVVLVFKCVEDEQTFFTLAFMKDKLCNQLGPHLNTIVYMFAQ